MSWLNVSRSITRHVTPSCSSAMMLAVRKSSLLKSPGEFNMKIFGTRFSAE
jgi:hypothetical protein